MSRWMRRPRFVVAAVVAALVVAAVGVTAYAATNTVFYACYNPTTRTLNKVSLGVASPCGSGETPVSWSQNGPTGATGPTGPTGATGPAGSAANVSVYQTNSTVTCPNGNNCDVTVFCNSGDSVTGGGVGPFLPNAGVTVTNSVPLGSAGWDGTIYNNSGAGVDIFVYAVCLHTS